MFKRDRSTPPTDHRHTRPFFLAVCALSLSLFALLGLRPGALQPTAFAATSTNVAYIFDFGTGVGDSGGPGSGSSIFDNAVTGSTLANGGTYNGATFTNVPVSTIDASPGTALSSYNTAVLYEVCDIGSHPATLTALNNFVLAGKKLMIFDADRCAAGIGGVATYSGFLFPFATSSPGPRGAGGSYTAVVANTPLTSGITTGPVPGDEVGDGNIFTTHVGAWCDSVTATNTLGTTGLIQAFARTASGGLAIYEGGDFWFSFGATAHLKLVFDDMLAQPFNPDGLSCPFAASGITLSPATSTNPIGTPHTDTATVVDVNHVPRSGVTVTFTITSGPDSGATGTGVTNASGQATFTFTDTTLPGTDKVFASFVDGSGITETSNEADKIWTRQGTTLTLTGATTSHFNDPATLSAKLVDSNGAAISGQTIIFTLDGQSCSGTTNATGVASCSITPNEAAGSYPLTANFAGTAKYLPSSASGTFIVTLEDSSVSSTTTLQVFAQGGSATLSSTLTDPASAAEGESAATPIVGYPVKMTLTNTANSASTQSCTGITNASGVATCTISPVTVALGPATVTDSFTDATNHYQPASNVQQALVFAFAPGGGAFVIGDEESALGTHVTFWGAQWAKINDMTGGSGPASFKGFAESPAVPSCGTTWSSDPGNSTPPPDGPLPAFMGVIVSSSVSQSGSTITGNILSIVVVTTNPGYDSNPGHAGTGTIVAKFC